MQQVDTFEQLSSMYNYSSDILRNCVSVYVATVRSLVKVDCPCPCVSSICHAELHSPNLAIMHASDNAMHVSFVPNTLCAG